MATINLASTPLVDIDLTAIEDVPSVPIINAYSTPGSPVWFSAGETRFTATYQRIYQVTAWAPIEISNVTCSGTDQLAVNFRARLFNDTTGSEVPAGIFTYQVYRAIGSKRFSVGNGGDIMVNFNREFLCGNGGLLIAGHRYRVRYGIKKEQAVGTPTADVVAYDATAFSEVAVRVNMLEQ